MLQLIYLIAVKEKKRPSKSNSTSGDSRRADLKHGVTFNSLFS